MIELLLIERYRVRQSCVQKSLKIKAVVKIFVDYLNKIGCDREIYNMKRFFGMFKGVAVVRADKYKRAFGQSDTRFVYQMYNIVVQCEKYFKKVMRVNKKVFVPAHEAPACEFGICVYKKA